MATTARVEADQRTVRESRGLKTEREKERRNPYALKHGLKARSRADTTDECSGTARLSPRQRITPAQNKANLSSVCVDYLRTYVENANGGHKRKQLHGRARAEIHAESNELGRDPACTSVKAKHSGLVRDPDDVSGSAAAAAYAPAQNKPNSSCVNVYPARTCVENAVKLRRTRLTAPVGFRLGPSPDRRTRVGWALPTIRTHYETEG